MELWDRQPPPPVTALIDGRFDDITIEEAVEALGQLVTELHKCVGEFTILGGSYVAERAVETAEFIQQHYPELDEVEHPAPGASGKIEQAIKDALAD